jgi:hypothetical protein
VQSFEKKKEKKINKTGKKKDLKKKEKLSLEGKKRGKKNKTRKIISQR